MRRDIDFPQDVFYIEDHPTNVHLMEALFRHCDHLHLVVARNGRDAHALASTTSPVLMLVDRRLPDCDGRSLLAQLREAHGWHDVPAVLVTADPSVDIRDSGFCELWPKPLDLGHVLDRLAALTGGRREMFQHRRATGSAGGPASATPHVR